MANVKDAAQRASGKSPMNQGASRLVTDNERSVRNASENMGWAHSELVSGVHIWRDETHYAFTPGTFPYRNASTAIGMPVNTLKNGAFRRSPGFRGFPPRLIDWSSATICHSC